MSEHNLKPRAVYCYECGHELTTDRPTPVYCPSLKCPGRLEAACPPVMCNIVWSAIDGSRISLWRGHPDRNVPTWAPERVQPFAVFAAAGVSPGILTSVDGAPMPRATTIRTHRA